MLKALTKSLQEQVLFYKLKKKRLSAKEKKAIDLIIRLRSILGDIVLRDFPEKADRELLAVYYGPE